MANRWTSVKLDVRIPSVLWFVPFWPNEFTNKEFTNLSYVRHLPDKDWLVIELHSRIKQGDVTGGWWCFCFSPTSQYTSYTLTCYHTRPELRNREHMVSYQVLFPPSVELVLPRVWSHCIKSKKTAELPLLAGFPARHELSKKALKKEAAAVCLNPENCRFHSHILSF